MSYPHTGLANPNVTSVQAITYWSSQGAYPTNYGLPFTVVNYDNNFNGSPQNSHFRAINIAVDLTGAASARMVTYLDYWGATRTYVANYSGIHPVLGTALVSVGGSIDEASLQVGN